jgi:cysteine-rich repeat protein
VRANGASAGSGGDVSLEGCDLTVTAGAQVLTNGPEGTNELAAHDLLTVYGTVQAGKSNRLAFGDPARPPIVTGIVTPSVVPIVDPELVPCVLGAACGDGTVVAPEECDDGNTQACDGCSPACRQEVCGNGHLDCGEECDPPDDVLCEPGCRARQTVVQRLPGGSIRHGCQVEWEVANASGTLTRSGLPTRAQSCTDGDPACDADGTSDGECRFRARVCLRVDDPRLPECQPAALEYVSVRAPRPLSPGDATEAANASALVDALHALGITVRAGSVELFPGTPEPQADRCTAPLLLEVPHGGHKGRRRFTIGSADVEGHRLASNSIKLDCLPNGAVCGDGVLGDGEECEDGNTVPCDGCSPSCHQEVCGNGVVDCHEDCDDGPFNASPGSTCTAQCREPMPALRIPGGGGRTIDCALEWSAALDPANVDADSRSLPRNRQTCVDGDPACDFDATAGSCRFHLFMCLGGGDARLGCPPVAVSSLDLLRPAVGDPARAAFVDSLQAIGLPVGPGEQCSARIAVDVSVGRQFRAQTRARLASGKTDSDSLKLKCLAAP